MVASNKINATVGPILPQILRYGFPLLLSTLVQQLFSSVDIAVLGNLADTASVAAVGANSSVINLILYLFLGIADGAGILLARSIGAQNFDRVRKIVDTTIFFAAGAGIFLAIVGWRLAPIILSLVNCPADSFAGAVLYLRIYLLAAPAVLLQNFGCVMLNTSGNTRSPLYFMLAGGTLKVILNVALCLLLPNKVLAVALATAFSQILWAVLAMLRLTGGADLVCFHLRHPAFDRTVLRRILAHGLPISLYKSLYPLSNLQVQAAINSLGSVVVAGNSAAVALEGIVNSFSVTIASCSAVFVGQNLGAEQPERVRRSFRCCLGLSLTVVNTLAISLYLSGRFWLGLLLPDSPDSAEYALIRMGLLLVFFGIDSISAVMAQALQSFGYSVLTSANSILFVLIFRVGWMFFIYPQYRTYNCLITCFLVSWCLVMLTNAVMCIIVFRRYRKGLYKRF